MNVAVKALYLAIHCLIGSDKMTKETSPASSGMKTLDLSFECPRICCSLQRLPPYRMHLCILTEATLDDSFALSPLILMVKLDNLHIIHHGRVLSVSGSQAEMESDETRQFH